MGLATLVLGAAGIKRAWAQSTCLCNGQTYDPSSQCCTNVGVISMNFKQVPAGVSLDTIAALASACPSMSQPSSVCGQAGCAVGKPDCNGCGTDTIQLPAHFGKADFTACCNDHDCCYDGCGHLGGTCTTCTPDQATCDSAAVNCWDATCSAAYPSNTGLTNSVMYQYCLSAASAGAKLLASVGSSALVSGIKARCTCCQSTPCQNSCAGGACGALPPCTGGGDCVCFTSTEDAGACIHGDTPCASVQTCDSSLDCPDGTTCVATSCCGSFGVCGPLCNPLVVASPAVARAKAAAAGVTTPVQRLAGYF